jgi:aldose 1-epimerase
MERRLTLAFAGAVAATIAGCGGSHSPAQPQASQAPPAPPDPGHVQSATMLQPPGAGSPSYVALKRENFQKVMDGKKVDLFTIENGKGMVVRITNLGAKIEQILVPDKNGQLGDVVLGYDTIDGVIAGQPSMGAFIGRYANRIAGGKFTLDGVQYELAINDVNNHPNTLHGGKKGSRFRVFDAIQRSPASVEMSLVFEDGEEGFPGTVPLRVVYTVGQGDDLAIEYSAKAVNKKTVVNFTSHSFFNLSGNPAKPILDTELEVNASKVLDWNADYVPSGVLRDVAGTPMDFRKPKLVGADIAADYDLLKFGNGYDHMYVVDERSRHPKPSGYEKLHFAARAYDKASGRAMEVWSSEPGIQVVSGNGFSAKSPRDLGKGGVLFPFRSGLGLEPAHFPDSPNKPTFPTTVLKAGHTYTGKIVYRFYAAPE